MVAQACKRKEHSSTASIMLLKLCHKAGRPVKHTAPPPRTSCPSMRFMSERHTADVPYADGMLGSGIPSAHFA